MRYEVASELNPRYLQTQNMHDYYGIYHVVEVDEKETARVIETFDSEFDSDNRKKAYARARELNHLKRLME
jgi:hypothetical protein